MDQRSGLKYVTISFTLPDESIKNPPLEATGPLDTESMIAENK